jgi:thiamine biosynthesis protein ThiI
MIDTLYLIKIGEIRLKEGNRAEFERTLRQDLTRRLTTIEHRLSSREGRFYLKFDSAHAEQVEFILSRTPGINGWARSLRAPKDMQSITKAALQVLEAAMSRGALTFKIEARRSDKSFELDSYGIARTIGSSIIDTHADIGVDVHHPDITIFVEIREKAYVYGDGSPGVRGLPVGSGGRGLLLLSGGIDSPVAGFRMLSRGLALESLYFHSHPYTSQQAWDKVRDLALNLATFSGGMLLHTIQFTEVQLKIKKDAPADRSTLYLRACMMMAAEMVARSRVLNAIVTGESLGQVASQTAENMRFTESYTTYPVLRPLVGTDKEDTIRTARSIGTYELSILPYEDCCVLFSPKHPVLKAQFNAEREAFGLTGLTDVVTEAVRTMQTLSLPFSFTPPRAEARR